MSFSADFDHVSAGNHASQRWYIFVFIRIYMYSFYIPHLPPEWHHRKHFAPNEPEKKMYTLFGNTKTSRENLLVYTCIARVACYLSGGNVTLDFWHLFRFKYVCKITRPVFALKTTTRRRKFLCKTKRLKCVSSDLKCRSTGVVAFPRN